MEQCAECGRVISDLADAEYADGLPFCSQECRAEYRRAQALREFEHGQYDEYTNEELGQYWPEDDYRR